MKKNYYCGLSVLLLFITAVSCNNRDNLNVAVKDSDNVYLFTAHYNPTKTDRVQRLINNEISPTHLKEDNDWNISATLDDRTTFQVISEPGDLEIQLNKNENSKRSFRRVQRMCEEIKKVIVEK